MQTSLAFCVSQATARFWVIARKLPSFPHGVVERTAAARQGWDRIQPSKSCRHWSNKSDCNPDALRLFKLAPLIPWHVSVAAAAGTTANPSFN